ncbi:MAG: EutN/CcmL family microcompartment protein [Pseudomonadota bacterium]
MIIARVIGTAVATVKHPSYNGRKVMIVQPLAPEGEDQGQSFLAVDAVQSGPGDRVLVAREGNAARQILEAGEAPIHAVILGIIDEVNLPN